MSNEEPLKYDCNRYNIISELKITQFPLLNDNSCNSVEKIIVVVMKYSCCGYGFCIVLFMLF